MSIAIPETAAGIGGHGRVAFVTDEPKSIDARKSRSPSGRGSGSYALGYRHQLGEEATTLDIATAVAPAVYLNDLIGVIHGISISITTASTQVQDSQATTGHHDCNGVIRQSTRVIVRISVPP